MDFKATEGVGEKSPLLFPGTCRLTFHSSQHWDNGLFKLSQDLCSYHWSHTRQEFCLETLL